MASKKGQASVEAATAGARQAAASTASESGTSGSGLRRLSRYVVQMKDDVTTATGAGSGTAEKQMWVDVATVSVPAKTKRKTVIEKALAQAGLDSGELTLRVLDEDSAHESVVEWEQPPPRLKIR